MRPEAVFIHGDAARVVRGLPCGFADLCVTSPPYWGLRDYGGGAEEIGAEDHFDCYLDRLTDVFDAVWGALKPDGAMWLNLGDVYAGGTRGARNAPEPGGGPRVKTGGERDVQRGATGMKEGCLVGLPWKAVGALVARGWILRADVVWEKPNPQPQPPQNRPTSAHEYFFLLVKSMGYWWDRDAAREPTADGEGTRNMRDVWRVPTYRYPGAHFAVMPPTLARRAILTACPPGGLVIDPFAGAGTTGCVAVEAGRNFLGVELVEDNIRQAEERTAQAGAGGKWK